MKSIKDVPRKEEDIFDILYHWFPLDQEQFKLC